MGSESDSDYESLTLSERREHNIRKHQEFLQSLLQTEEFREAKQLLKGFQAAPTPKPQKRKRSRSDVTFHARINPFLERRKSARLANQQPQYTFEDLPDESQIHKFRVIDDIDDLEEVIYTPKPARKSLTKAIRVVPVSEITPEYLSKIATTGLKVYDPHSGTTCHQCRQKTRDSKTHCRSGFCVGVRGNFCGPCLKNRYGEDAAVALMDPDWRCPNCRGICNCSFCRARAGKRPTGILTPIARRMGHGNVHNFLLEFNEKAVFGEGKDCAVVGVERLKFELKNLTSDDESVCVGFNGKEVVMKVSSELV